MIHKACTFQRYASDGAGSYSNIKGIARCEIALDSLSCKFRCWPRSA